MDANEEAQVALSAKLGIVPSALNSIINNRKDIRKCYTKCGSVCGQRKNLKQSAFQKQGSLLATLFKLARASSAIISGTLLRENALHTYTRLGFDFKASNGWISGLKQ